MNRVAPLALLLALVVAPLVPADEPADPVPPTASVDAPTAREATADDPTSAEPVSEESETRYVLVFGSSRPWVAEIHITVQGRSHREHWKQWLAEKFEDYDTNGNGHLDGDEIGRVVRQNNPSPGNAFLNFFRNGSQESSITGDTDGDGVITVDELAKYHRGEREGEFRIEEDAPSGVDLRALSVAIGTALDTDGDESLSRDELEAALVTSSKLDRDEDELVSTSEVSSRSQQVVFYNDNSTVPDTPDDLVDLPSNERSLRDLAHRLETRYRGAKSRKPGLARWELKWPNAEVFQRFDADGSGRLEENELVAFLREPVCDLRVNVAFRATRWWRSRGPNLSDENWLVESLDGTQGKKINVYRTGGNRFRVVTGGDSIEFLPPQSLDQAERTLVNNYTAQFDSADTDNNAYLDEQECNQYFYFNNLFEELDRDENGKVFKEELEVFLQRQLTTARSRTRLIVADRGRNLFDLLDGNRNGTITPREFVSGVDRVMGKDADKDGELADAEIPRFLRLTIQPAQPDFGNSRYLFGGQSGLTSYSGGQYRNQKDSPAWFRGMDRNRDGDVSEREFLGSLADFDRLDTDGDRLLSVEEAKQAGSTGKAEGADVETIETTEATD